MNDILNNIKASMTAYSEGFAAGWQEALLKVNSALTDVACSSRANQHKRSYDDIVVLLSDIDKVIDEMLEEANG